MARHCSRLRHPLDAETGTREKMVSTRISNAVTKKPRPNILRRTTSRANVATFAPMQKTLRLRTLYVVGEMAILR